MKSYVFENKNFRLTVGENAITESLIYKATGEELLMKGENVSIFSLTQLRPFNNEVKLAYMNKRTAFEANEISVEGNKIKVGFEIIPSKAEITFEIKDEYISFTLTDLVYPLPEDKNFCIDLPPVEEVRILQLPIKNRRNFGQWINAIWDEKASCAVIAANPEAIIDSERREGYRVLTADAKKEVQLEGTTAALIVSGGKDAFLNAVDKLERDFGLPLGVEGRKNPIINRSIYWAADLTPSNVDEHIKYAKMGGFSCMLLYYECMCPILYDNCGDYSLNEHYPNGFGELCDTVNKIKAAGITPGFHFLHTHIGHLTKYVTPVADPRLNISDYYTLTRPLGLDDDKIYIAQNPKNAKKYFKRRVLKFGGELMTYEGFSTTPPYHFYGVKRGYWDTNVTTHDAGIIGGILDVSECLARSVYIDQNTDLQDEIAVEIAKIYDCGFEFIYFDGSEGTNIPYEYHIPNAQYRVLKKLGSAPLFCEGAAKAHFAWHYLSGANAFDAFKTDIFKEMLDRHPLAEAPHMAEDFTRLNFGWWAFFDDTRRDVYEYGTSHAHGWKCPATVQASLERFEKHARVKDIFEVMRRWEEVRKDDLLTDAELELIRAPGKEYTLFINEEGKYELIEYFKHRDFCPESSELHAFTLERAGRSYALLWHNTGSAKIEIPVSDCEARYVSDLTRNHLPIEEKDEKITINVGESAYLSTNLSVDELRAALTKSVII